jgi:hypothetical protein
MGDAGVGYWGRDAVTGQPTFGGAAGVGVNQGTAATSAATAGRPQDPTRTYSLRGVFFKREQFSSVADCLTAAHAEGLPLEVCK